MLRLAPLLLTALAACAPDEGPPACVQMCAAAAGLYGGCLDDWGADWSAAGYADEADFIDACETWSWEMSLLEADAVDRGEAGAAGALARTCRDRGAAFSDPEATCDAYTGVDWNARPWEPPTEQDSGAN